MYDIWTFIDASVSVNEYTHSRTGVYGFVHMCIDKKGGNLIPVQTGFGTAPTTEIDVLECFALWLGLMDIQSNRYSGKIGIFTDSKNVHNNIVAVSKSVYPKWYYHPNNHFRESVVYVAGLYSQMLRSFNIDMNLVKSHVKEWGEQIRYFEKNGIKINAQYAKHVCIGNAYVDYYVSNIAKCQSIKVLQPYDKKPAFQW